MLSQFPSSCLMALPNSQVFLSDKDLNDMDRLNIFLRSSPPQDPLQGRAAADDPDDRRDKRRRPSPPLMIRIPAPYEDKDDDEGLNTPTSAIHRISEMLQCPPAPRKPKSLQSKKRRAPRPVLLLDLSREIDCLFPRPVLFEVGGQIKKFKT